MLKNEQPPRMYLVLREDLAYKYIQGGHALAQFALEHYDLFKEWNNEYLINLSVFNGLSLKGLTEDLDRKGIIYSAFVEPDLESELPTAIAHYGTGECFGGLPLATK